jgi:hypothetical protein
VPPTRTWRGWIARSRRTGSGGLAEHHRTRRGDRLHPLRQPDLLADRGVTQDARTDLTGNHLARIQAHPQEKIDAVTVVHLGGKALGLSLDAQGRQACADGVILQRYWRPEYRHQAVTGELVHRAAVAAHHGRAAADQLGHDLAQPLRAHRGGDIHRTHHVGEQHRHLFELGMAVRPGQRGAAGVAVPSTRPRGFGATGCAHQSGCGHPSPSIKGHVMNALLVFRVLLAIVVLIGLSLLFRARRGGGATEPGLVPTIPVIDGLMLGCRCEW